MNGSRTRGDDEFEAERTRLVGLAYRITGSRAEAEDVVQDAWLRWQGADADAIDRPAAWLTTVTSRIALDHLKSASRSRETYVGPWLPEVANLEPGPEAQVELAESLSMGFLLVLERLAPVERVVFLLAEVFKVPFDDIATVVDRSPAACRQVASRARRRVHEERPRFAPTDDEAWEVAAAFLVALQTGDVARVVSMLAPEVVSTGDGGSEHLAARRPVVGPTRVARYLLNLAGRVTPAMEVEPRLVNGQPGAVIREGDEIVVAVAVSVVDGLIDRVYALVNPAKTASVDSAPIA